MRFLKQKCVHIPQVGLFGDCFRTALACVLDKELDDVPHFMQLYAERRDKCEAAIEEWLNQRGYSNIVIPYQMPEDWTRDMLLDVIAKQNGDNLLYLFTGKSIADNEHVVICRGNKILWDPSPSNTGVVASINGFYFVTHILPVSMRLNDVELLRLLNEESNE